MQDIKGFSGVFTGGGDGIGRALVLAAAKAGMNVGIADIRKAAAEAVADEAKALGVEAHAYQVDVSVEEDVHAFGEAARRDLGAIHLVWANAGLGIGQSFIDAKREQLRWMYAVNLDGVIDTVRAFVPQMREMTGWRHVGITGSMAGLTHQDGLGPYGASKYAVVGVAEGLAADLKGEGIGVTCLCPGLVNTRIWDGHRARPERFGGPRNAPEEFGERWREQGMGVEAVGEWGVEAARLRQFYAVMPDDEARGRRIQERTDLLMASIRYPNG